MARRLFLTLLLAGLAAAAWWIARPVPPKEEGLVVHVLVVDQAGRPLENAQVQKVFDPGYRVVDSAGRLRLTHVPLREAEQPSRGALRSAVQVRAPYYSLRQGFEPEIAQRDDGAWAMRFPLHHHGVMRLHVRPTHLGLAKAYPEPDQPLQRWEAMDAGNVARPDAPAAFRIYPGAEFIVVRITGELDMHGVTGIATRRFFLEPPGPGYIVERTVVPDEVQPILGTVLLPEGAELPSWRSQVHVTELATGGRRIEHEPVSIEPDGRFVVRTVGTGRYELAASFDFLTPPEPVVVNAGDSVELKGAALLPWVVLRHPGADGQALELNFWAGRKAEQPLARVPVLYRGEESVVALPDGGPWHLHARTHGSPKTPPLDVRAEVDARPGASVAADARVETAPHGTLVVRASPNGWASARAATVTVEGRAHTLLRKLAEQVEIPHVRAGDVSVDVEWNDSTAAPLRLDVEVKAGGRAEVSIACRTGGWVALRGRGPRAASEAGDMHLRLVTWHSATGPRAGTMTEWGLRCVRRNAAPLWIAERALAPGEYEVLLPPDGFLQGVKVDTDRFTIEAGQTTTIPFEVPRR